MEEVRFEVKRVNGEQDMDLPFPRYMSDGAAGMDLAAALQGELTHPPLAPAGNPTGFAFAMPVGYEGQVRPRSGLAAAHGVTVLNPPGTLASADRGEVKVILINLGSDPYVVRRGDRIAQLVVCPVTRASPTHAASLEETERAHGGFGHTGD